MDGMNETSTSNPSNDNSNDFNGLNALLLAAQRNTNPNSSHHSSSSSSSRSSTPSHQNHPHSNPQAHYHPQSHSHSMPPPPPRNASRSQVNRSKIQLPSSSSSTSTQSCCPSETTIICSSSNQDQSSCSIPNCTISESCPLIHSCSKACQESTCTGATTSTNAINHQPPKDKAKDTGCCSLENGAFDLDFSTSCWDFGCDFPISNPPCASNSNQTSTSIDKSQSPNRISKSRSQVGSVNQNMNSVFCETCDGQQSSNNRDKVFDSFQELLDCCCCSTDSNLENCCPPNSTIPSTEDCCSSSKLNVSTMETCCSNEGEAQSTTSSSKEEGNGAITIDERSRIEEGWYESFCEENHHRHDESCNLNHQHHQQQIGSRSITIPNRKKVERFQNQFSSRTKASHGDRNDSGSSSSSNASDTTPTLIPSSSSSTSESSTNPRSRSASISNGPGISDLNSNHLQNNYQSFIVPSNSNMTSSNFINNNSNRFGSNNDSKQGSMMDSLNDYCRLRIPHQHDEFGGCLDPTLTLCDPLKCNVEAPHSHLQSQILSSKVIREINKGQEGEEEEQQFKCGWVDCGHVARSVAELSDHVQTRHILEMKKGKTRMNGGSIGNGNGNEASDRDAMNGLESRDLNRWYHQQQQPSHSHGQFHHQQHQPQFQNHHQHHQNNYSHPHSHAHSHPVHHHHHHEQHQGFQSQNQQNQNQNQNPSVDSNSTSSSSLSLSESQLQLQEQVALAFEQCLWDQCQIPMSNNDCSTNLPSSSHQILSNGHQFQTSNGGSNYIQSNPNHGNFMNERETNSSVNTPSTTTPNTSNTDSSINSLTSSSSSSTPNHQGNEKITTTTSSSSFLLQHLISDHLGILPSDSEQILNSLGLNGENLNKFLGGLNNHNHNHNHTRDDNDEFGSYHSSLGGQGVESSVTTSTGSKRKRNQNLNNKSGSNNGTQASPSTFLNKRTKSIDQNSNGRRSSRNLKCNSQTHSHGKRIEREEEGMINEGNSTDSTLSPLSKISQDSPYDHHQHHHQNQGSSSSSNPSHPTKSTITSTSKQINADHQQQQQEVVNPDHICDWLDCGLKFNSYEELTKHVNELHVGSGKSTYECKWKDCQRANEGRLFTQRQKVLRHMQTHTGDRPYKCDICSKRFSEPNTLTQHIRTHTNEKPYVCDFPNCGKSFAIAGSLTIHKRTHTGDKPFMCSHPGCGKAFSESSNLTKHMRTHSGERPFKCPECDRCFSRPDQMNRHRKAHDNPNSKLNNKVEGVTT